MDIQNMNDEPYVPLEKLIEDVGCDPEEREWFDLDGWNNNTTDDINELNRRLDSMNLVGRTIKDIRFVSYSYEMTEDGITERIFNMTEGYPKDIQRYLCELEHVDDLFPFPLWQQLDGPVLIKFEDGDQFEIETPLVKYFTVSMNEIPWNAEAPINGENVNGSILFDLCKGFKITKVEVEWGRPPFSLDDGEGIEKVRLHINKDRDYFDIVFESDCHDYMMVSVEDYPNHTAFCPFIKVKQSLYKK